MFVMAYKYKNLMNSVMNLVMVNKRRMKMFDKTWKDHEVNNLVESILLICLKGPEERLALSLSRAAHCWHEISCQFQMRWKTVTIPIVLVSPVKMRNQSGVLGDL